MSCGLFCYDSCGCGPLPTPQEFKIQSFITQTVNQSGQEITDSDAKPYDQIFKSLRIDSVEFIRQSSLPPYSYSSFGTAFACSPIQPSSVNTLKLIQIINQKEFSLADGRTFKVGDPISTLFGMKYFHASGLTPIDNFIAPGKILVLDELYKIGLLQDPEKELKLEFTILLVFDDAQDFSIADQVLNIY